jgi:hypothetical protein
MRPPILINSSSSKNRFLFEMEWPPSQNNMINQYKQEQETHQSELVRIIGGGMAAF